MKLTAEEIRRRVKDIAAYPTLEPKILQLIEDATGEKIPEPFDESKVGHLSVWASKCGTYHALIVAGMGKQLRVVVTHRNGTVWDATDGWGDITKVLREYPYTHLGQYDFNAGLPKGGGL